MSHNIQELVVDWISCWNAHNLDGIMSHYALDAEFEASTVVSRWNRIDGKLSGKEEIREHFRLGLELAPNLHFTLESIFQAPSGYAVLYQRENGNRVIDRVVLDQHGKAKEITAYYAATQK